MSIGYLIVFVLVKSFGWGINIQNWATEFYIKPSFFALSGMLSLSYFIHNIIISVMRHNKEQKHNVSISWLFIIWNTYKTLFYIFLGTGSHYSVYADYFHLHACWSCFLYLLSTGEVLYWRCKYATSRLIRMLECKIFTQFMFFSRISWTTSQNVTRWQ